MEPNQKTEPPSESSDEILTPEEIAHALQMARKAKQAKAATEAYWKKLSQPVEYPKFTADTFLYAVLENAKKEYGEGFGMDSENQRIYEALAMYFTGDERFRTYGANFSLSKGLLLHGNVGCGKTTALKVFSINPVQSFAIVSCRQLAYEFSQGGYEAVEKYAYMLDVSIPQRYFNQRQIGWCFDDLGTESITKHYGQQANIMAEVLQNRYDNHQCRGNKTHLTTNLTADQIDDTYGVRVRSRMREMFNLIAFPETAKDRRS